jgi:hypothetical protein
VLTVATSVIVTSLITFHLLRARRVFSKYLSSADMRLYTGVVAILIESALPLSFFGVIAAVLRRTIDITIAAKQTEGHVVSYVLFTGLFYSFCVS